MSRFRKSVMAAGKLYPVCFIVSLFSFSTLVAVNSSGLISTRDIESHETEDEESKPLVFLTVSSLASRIRNQQDRMLELNWDRIPESSFEDDDAQVRLYDRDPFYDSSNPLVSVKPGSEGYYRTAVRFPEQIFSENNLSDACLGFWIAFTRNDKILSTNCIRARPHWMHQARPAIGNLSLIDLMIPGTHNTGSYAPFDPKVDTLFNRYLITQEEGVWNQLVYGIRYLDLRVAYHSSNTSPERFWITHSSFRTNIAVRDVLRQVKQFLNATTEIIILDFHRFVTGFQSRYTALRHAQLISMLEEELGHYMIPVHYTSWATLNQLWAADKRLYVGYADENARRQSSYLFPAIKHLWGDVDTVNDLESYLNRTVCEPVSKRLTSAMAQLTPTTAGAIFNIYGGLRNMADAVNRQITRWFRDEWNNCANIVATDFFHGNNIIEVAIETNKKKYSMAV